MSEAPTFTPARARFFDLIDQTLKLAPEEIAHLERDGVVVTDRLTFDDFCTAYAYLFWKDLPLLITTDSLLQALHQSYEDLLQWTEFGLCIPRLTSLLTECRAAVRESIARQDSLLAPLLSDLDVYLTVPLALLSQLQDSQLVVPDALDGSELSGAEQKYLKLATEAAGPVTISLFGQPRDIDFSLFKPRGHYAEQPIRQTYFQAMSWLAQIDFRIVDYDHHGRPSLNLEALAAAMLLREALAQSGQRSACDDLDRLLTGLVGRSDDMTLPDLERFLADAALDSPATVLRHPAPEVLLRRLMGGNYGHQLISGQIQKRDLLISPMPRPVSFRLLGARFVLDSWLLGELAYDRLVVDGQAVPRPLPSPLDVLAALGNPRALHHLQGELARYGYLEKLQVLSDGLAHQEDTFWQGSLYHQLLYALGTLHGDTVPDGGQLYPPALRGPAWADKMLHTQLAAWAQLRHDNILYVKEPFSWALICDYPAGYVEPYPAFYAALGTYAEMGAALFGGLAKPADAETAEIEESIGEMAASYFELQFQARQAQRDDCFEQVLALRTLGLSLVQIAQRVGRSERTIRTWLRRGTAPTHKQARKRRSIFDPYAAYVLNRWQAGVQDGRQLYEELVARGYKGSLRTVQRFIHMLRPNRRTLAELIPPSPTDQFSAREAVWLFLRDPADLSAGEAERLTCIRHASTRADTAYSLVQAFVGMMRQRQADQLPAWLESVHASRLVELQRFAGGILKDYEAVLASLTHSYSNGPVEAHVHKLKLVKRAMFGRAKLPLLRQRLLQTW